MINILSKKETKETQTLVTLEDWLKGIKRIKTSGCDTSTALGLAPSRQNQSSLITAKESHSKHHWYENIGDPVRGLPSHSTCPSCTLALFLELAQTQPQVEFGMVPLYDFGRHWEASDCSNGSLYSRGSQGSTKIPGIVHKEREGEISDDNPTQRS